MTTYVDLLGDLLRSGAAADPELAEAVHAAYLEELGVGTFGAVTAGGLPYPVPTDPVAAGADAIRALAEAVDVKFSDYRTQTANDSRSIGTGVWTTVPVGTAETSAGSSVAAGTTGMTIAQTGEFLIHALVLWGPFAAAATPMIGVSQIGDAGPSAFYRSSTQLSTGSITIAAAWTRRHTAGDTVVLFANQSSGASVPITTRRLAIHRIG